jgi:hypothetical protein
MISESEMHEALMFIAGSDEDHATAFADAERAEERAKQIKAAQFLLQAGTVAERDAKALTSEEYKLAQEEHWAAVAEFRRLDNMRRTCDLKIRAWQTVSSNRRQGTV